MADVPVPVCLNCGLALWQNSPANRFPIYDIASGPMPLVGGEWVLL
jgi:hypothetical protein